MKLLNMTPQTQRCIGSACPAIYTTDHNTYVVVGQRLQASDLRQLDVPITPSEAAVEFPKTLLEELRRKN